MTEESGRRRLGHVAEGEGRGGEGGNVLSPRTDIEEVREVLSPAEVVRVAELAAAQLCCLAVVVYSVQGWSAEARETVSAFCRIRTVIVRLDSTLPEADEPDLAAGGGGSVSSGRKGGSKKDDPQDGHDTHC